MKTKSPLTLSLLLLGGLVAASVAPAAVVTWTNSNGGLWSAATNWNSGTAPAVGDAVVITNAGVYTVTQDLHVTLASLALGDASGSQTLTNAGYTLTLNGASAIHANGVLGFGNGTLAGTGLLTVSGRAIWGAGSWGSAVFIAPGGALDLVGNVDKTLSGSVTNQGTMTWSGTNHLYMASGRINNLPGALFDIQNNRLILNSSGAPNVHNSGIIRKSSGGGDSTIGVPLINSGTLDVLSGRVGYVSGSQFNSGTAFTGTGTNTVYTGTVTFNGALTSENLEITSDGTLTVAGTHALSGTARWLGGTISGAMTIATNGTLQIAGTLDRVLSGALNNQGLMVWSGVNTFYMAGGHVTNLAGGVFEIHNNQNILASGGVPNVNNAGTIRKSSGAGTSVIAVPLVNSGALDVQSGTLAYWGGSQFNSGTVFTGAGTNTVYTGTVTFNGALSSENLEIASDNTLTLAGTHTLSGTARWLGGTISGAMTIATNGTLQIAGTLDRVFSGALNNQGLMVWSGVNTFYLAGGHVTNLAGGVFEIHNNQNILASGGVPNVHNSGIIRKSSGGGVSVIAAKLINSGALDVQSGTLAYWGGSQFNSGTAFTGAGTNTVYTGTVTFNGALSSENLEIASDNTLTLAGTHTLSGTVRWIGGTISGAMTIATNGTLNIFGTADRAVSGSLINQGLMVWSGPNTIHLSSGYLTNLASGVFEIQNNQIILVVSGVPNVHNSGTIRKSSGGGVSVIAAKLINSGTLDVQSGQINYWGGSQFNSGTAFTGTGTNTVYTGTVTFNGAITSENLEIASDNTLTLAGTHTLSGTVRWLGGTISGAMTIASNSTFNISGTADRALSGSLNNQGVVTWSGAHNIYAHNAPITNAAGALFDIQNNQVFSLYNGSPKFHNAGTIRKSSGGGDTFFTVPALNTGILDVQSGRIAYGTGCQFNSGTLFTGPGTNNFVYTGTATFNGIIPSENLEIASDGTLAFGGNCTFSGVVNWTGGTLADDSGFTIATNGTLHIRGTADRSVVGSLTNLGTITWSGLHNIDARLSARIVNESGALFDIQNNQVLSIYNGAPRVINNGTIRKSSGGGDTFITVPVINAGTLEAQSGRIAYGPNGQFNTGTTFTGAGTNLLYNGNATLNGAISSDNLEIGGAVILGTNTLSGFVRWTSGAIGEDARMTIPTNTTLNLLGTLDRTIQGALINAGLVNWSGGGVIYFVHLGTVSNLAGGTFDMQADGVLAHNSGVSTFRNAGLLRKSAGPGNSTINLSTFQNTGTVDAQNGQIVFGNYTHTGGKLSFGLNSLTNFGRVAFANSIAFNGTLGANLNGGYLPVAGDAFAVITYPSRTGTFADFALPSSHAWQTNSSIYGATAVTLTVLNTRPSFTTITDQTSNEQVLLSLPITGNDPDSGQTVTYALLDPPGGATINTNSGLFSWTPTEAQGPTTNTITVQITDNGTPSLSATNAFTVVVNEVNRAPTIIVPATQTFDEMTMLTAPSSATDPDIPANSFHYSLVSGPDGVTVDTNSGLLTWTPTEAQGPSSNTITVAVIDDGTPPLSNTNSFTIIVREVNCAPVLTPLADCTHVTGAICWITNSASGPDVPSGQLTFSLLNAPPGMMIGPTTGLMIWGPSANCASLTNTVTVRVTDDGLPALTNEQTFVATLIASPRLKIAPAGPSLVVLSWPAAATDAGFALQSATNLLTPPGWQNVAGTPVVSAGENFLTNSATMSFRAYRLASALTPLPTLQIAAANPHAVLVSWPATATATGFVLQAAPNLQPPVGWSDATNSLGTNGSLSFITEPLAGPQRYYRLRLPALP